MIENNYYDEIKRRAEESSLLIQKKFPLVGKSLFNELNLEWLG